VLCNLLTINLSTNTYYMHNKSKEPQPKHKIHHIHMILCQCHAGAGAGVFLQKSDIDSWNNCKITRLDEEVEVKGLTGLTLKSKFNVKYKGKTNKVYYLCIYSLLPHWDWWDSHSHSSYSPQNVPSGFSLIYAVRTDRRWDINIPPFPLKPQNYCCCYC
jgi:hypothetical protein